MTWFRIGLMALVVLAAHAVTRAQSPEELAQTGRYVAAFQNPDGGFAAKEGGASNLGTTSSAIRTLKNVAGSIRDVPACIAFVRKCRDADSGGTANVMRPLPGFATCCVSPGCGAAVVPIAMIGTFWYRTRC